MQSSALHGDVQTPLCLVAVLSFRCLWRLHPPRLPSGGHHRDCRHHKLRALHPGEDQQQLFKQCLGEELAQQLCWRLVWCLGKASLQHTSRRQQHKVEDAQDRKRSSCCSFSSPERSPIPIVKLVFEMESGLLAAGKCPSTVLVDYAQLHTTPCSAAPVAHPPVQLQASLAESVGCIEMNL